MREIHLAHPTGAEQADDFVNAEAGAGSELQACVCPYAKRRVTSMKRQKIG